MIIAHTRIMILTNDNVGIVQLVTASQAARLSAPCRALDVIIVVVVVSSNKYLNIFVSKMKKIRKKNTCGPRDVNIV